MARKPRMASKTGVYHFINRGVNKKKIFHKDEDRAFYKGLLKEYSEKFGVAVFHYCFMANHTHLLLKADELSALSRFGHFIQRRYAYYYCKTHNWSEQVFRSRFLSLPIESDAYLLECGRYIERNPLDTGLIKDLKDFSYSSFNYYAFGRKDDLVTESPLYRSMGMNKPERRSAYRFYVSQPREKETELPIPF